MKEDRSRDEPEGHHIGQGVQFPSEGSANTEFSRQKTIEEIKYGRKQDDITHPLYLASENQYGGDATTKKVEGSQEVGQVLFQGTKPAGRVKVMIE